MLVLRSPARVLYDLRRTKNVDSFTFMDNIDAEELYDFLYALLPMHKTSPII